jgi:ABC-type nitrate/sulfonate/bicarbonate transport system substrate-binding protein
MGKFVIAPHMRLQEWVAEEKGYFAAEGLDYEFRDQLTSKDGKLHDFGAKVGAFQTFEMGRTSDVSCACHWTVNVAASVGHGKLYRDCYSVAPAGIFVPPDSPIRAPEDLAGVPISVGYQSGSHYSTIQALEAYMPADKINLNFADGMLFHRLDQLIEGKSPASALFSGPYYFAEQLGFRKVIDTTFMIATMVTGDPEPEDLKKFFRALRRAQRELDIEPEPYKHYYSRELPPDLAALVDVRRFGPGERIVFEPYTRELYERTQRWMQTWDLFTPEQASQSRFEQAVLV